MIVAKKKPVVLCVIPARAGSKRIRNKNIRPFLRVPLIARTIAQSKQLRFVDRVVVDTDSSEIAEIAKRAGAIVPRLRPKHLAGDKSQVADSVIDLLAYLKREEKYSPDYVLLLQTTSPLREVEDIEACWKEMQEGGATAVLTVAPTHPRLYHLESGFLSLANKRKGRSSNMQAWQPGYLLNGCFAYIIKTEALIREKSFITRKTKTVVMPRWRSVDLDTPEDWVLAEVLYRNRSKIQKALKKFI